MIRGEIFDDNSIDYATINIDSEFRIKIEKSIINTKLLTHQCQYNCYNQNNTLINAENCARNCFKPLIFIKKNVTKLIENAKEKFEKCKINNKIKSQASAVLYNMEIRKCIYEYRGNLDEMKEEVEFIYDGYSKNFENLLLENKGKKL